MFSSGSGALPRTARAKPAVGERVAVSGTWEAPGIAAIASPLVRTIGSSMRRVNATTNACGPAPVTVLT